LEEKPRDSFSPKIGDCFLFQAVEDFRTLLLAVPAQMQTLQLGTSQHSLGLWCLSVPALWSGPVATPGTNCALLISSKGRPCRGCLCGCCPGHSRYHAMLARTDRAARPCPPCLLEVGTSHGGSPPSSDSPDAERRVELGAWPLSSTPGPTLPCPALPEQGLAGQGHCSGHNAVPFRESFPWSWSVWHLY
jgi:hypothetical protein